MRSIPFALEEKIEKLMQTIYEGADPWMDIVAQKTQRFITQGTLLAPVTIRTGSSLGPFQIAVRREDSNLDPSELVMAYVQNGEARVATLPYFPAPNETWTYRYTIGPATDIGIDFDGWWKFITDRTGIYYDTTRRWAKVSSGEPWIAYVTPGGALIVQQGQHGQPLTLATSSVTRVAVLRGWKNVILTNQDHGLVVAYIQNNKIWYRTYAQQSDETLVWEIARAVSLLPSPAQNVSLFRTNDYRLGFLGESNGMIHHVVTSRNWAGMAIDDHTIAGQIRDFTVGLIPIEHINAAAPHETIQAAVASAQIMLCPHVVPAVLEISNPDEFSIFIEFDVELAGDLAGQQGAFTVSDAGGNYAVSATAKVAPNTIALAVSNFSAANKGLTVTYNASLGSLHHIAPGGCQMWVASFSRFFMPDIAPPEGYADEMIKASFASVTVNLLSITHHDRYRAETISASLSRFSVVLTNINDLTP